MLDNLSVDQTFLALGVASGIKFTIQYLWRNRLPADSEYVGTVSSLHLYPIKSSKGFRSTRANCTSEGLTDKSLLDRQFVIIDGKGQSLSGRTSPKAATIATEVAGTTLTLSAPGAEPVCVDWMKISSSSPVTSFSLHGILPLEGKDCGDEVAAWLDRLLEQRGHHLLYKDVDTKKRSVHSEYLEKFAPWTRAAYNDKTQFQDIAPCMIMTSEGLAHLNSQLTNPVGMDRFRPNIVVSGTTGVHDEDTWKNIFIGKVHLRTLAGCGRCVFTTVDPETGTKDATNEPLETLRKYRCVLPGALKSSPVLGNLVVVRREGEIQDGDPVYVTRGITNQPGDIDDF